MAGAAQVLCCWSRDAAGCWSRALLMLWWLSVPLFSPCPHGWGSGMEGPGTAEPKMTSMMQDGPWRNRQLEKKNRIWPGAVKCAKGGLGRVTYVLGHTFSVPKSMVQTT